MICLLVFNVTEQCLIIYSSNTPYGEEKEDSLIGVNSDPYVNSSLRSLLRMEYSSKKQYGSNETTCNK